MEDIFIVGSVGKNFDKVTRIEAWSERLELFMQLDVNTEVYPIKQEERYAVKLTTTLDLDGTPDTAYYTPIKPGSIADNFDYIMHGKLYKILDEGSGANHKVEMLISFGGLLMSLKGNPDCITDFHLDQKYFLCMRKLI
nr:DNA-directed RNA polymerases II and V subunit 8A-like [Populus alba]